MTLGGVSGGQQLQQWLQANPAATLKDAVVEARKSHGDGQDTGIDHISTEELQVLEEHFELNIVDQHEMPEFMSRIGGANPAFEFDPNSIIFERTTVGSESGTRLVSREQVSNERTVDGPDKILAGDEGGNVDVDSRLTRLRNNTRHYINPNQPYRYTNDEGQSETVTLQNAILQDFADIKGVFEEPSDLYAAIQEAYPQSTLSEEEAVTLFNFIEYGNPSGENGAAPTSADVQELQEFMAKISEGFRELVGQNGANNGFDGKYGYATTEQIRNLRTELQETQTTETDSVDLIGFETVTPGDTQIGDIIDWKVYIDRSGSMWQNGHIQDLENTISHANIFNDEAEYDLYTFQDHSSQPTLSVAEDMNANQISRQLGQRSNFRSTGKQMDESGLTAALEQLRAAPTHNPEEPITKGILIVTDENEQAAESFQEVLQEARRSGTAIKVVDSRSGNIININQEAIDWINDNMQTDRWKPGHRIIDWRELSRQCPHCVEGNVRGH